MMVSIYWANLPLDDESVRVAKIMNAEYSDALEKDHTDKLFQRLKIVSRSRLNFIYSDFGTQGSGKSYKVIFLAEKFAGFSGKEISIDNVCFTITDLLKIVEQLDKGDIFILDEQIKTGGYGSYKEREILENVEMTVRQEKLSFFFLSPRLIHHNYHFYSETWQMGSAKPWDWGKPIESQWRYTKSILYNHRDHMLGYIITGAPSDKDFLEKYEKKKNKFIKLVRSRKGGARHEYLLSKAYDILGKRYFTDTMKNKRDFIKEFACSKTKRLKRLVMMIALGGEIITIEETNMLLDYLDYILSYDAKYSRIAASFVPKSGKRKAFKESR